MMQLQGTNTYKSTTPPVHDTALKAHDLRVKNDIKALGADRYDMRLPETKALSYVIRPDERILGIIFGRYKEGFEKKISGRGALIATNNRVILLDKKLMFIQSAEVIYQAISGVTYGRVGFMATVMLHTKVGDVQVRSMNKKCAKTFVEAIESKILSVNGGAL